MKVDNYEGCVQRPVSSCKLHSCNLHSESDAKMEKIEKNGVRERHDAIKCSFEHERINAKWR